MFGGIFVVMLNDNSLTEKDVRNETYRYLKQKLPQTTEISLLEIKKHFYDIYIPTEIDSVKSLTRPNELIWEQRVRNMVSHCKNGIINTDYGDIFLQKNGSGSIFSLYDINTESTILTNTKQQSPHSVNNVQVNHKPSHVPLETQADIYHRQRIGKLGEVLALQQLKSMGYNTEHSSRVIGDGLGYDVRGTNLFNEIFLEVKTSERDNSNVILTHTEYDFIQSHADNAFVLRISELTYDESLLSYIDDWNNIKEIEKLSQSCHYNVDMLDSKFIASNVTVKDYNLYVKRGQY